MKQSLILRWFQFSVLAVVLAEVVSRGDAAQAPELAGTNALTADEAMRRGILQYHSLTPNLFLCLHSSVLPRLGSGKYAAHAQNLILSIV